MTGLSGRLAGAVRRRSHIAIWLSGMLSVAALFGFAFSAISPLERLNHLVFDAYQGLKPRDAAGSPITVVDIDDESIGRLGQWPWPRTVLAQIIDRLTEMGAAVIGLDMLLAEPDRTSPVLAITQLRLQGYEIEEPEGRETLDHDRFLADSFARAPVVTGLALAETTRTPPPDPKAGFAFGGTNPVSYLPAYEGGVRNLALLDEAAAGIGLINFPPALDGVVREIPLVSRYGDKLYPALSMEALRVAQGASTYLVRSTGAHGEQDTGDPGMVAVKDGNFEVPTGPDGKMWVYYSGTRVAPLVPAYRFASVAPNTGLREIVEGHIVLIGTSAIGLRDLVSTPLASGVPGVLVHAEIIDQIIGGSFLSRPDWAVGAEVALAVVMALFVLAFLPWLPASANGFIALVAIATSMATGWLAFAWYNLLLSPLLPAQAALLAYGVGSGLRLLVSESEKRYIRSAFSHYLAPSMVEQLVENPQSLVLGGENKELTVLFCDIRGFTSLSEGLGPSQLTEFLNNYLTPMTDVLMQSGATIDKYMGDGIMAFWNAPLDIPGHREKACASLLAMETALAEFNRTFSRDISVGIGLNSGVCCVGNLGSRQRFDYSAIGDPVNVASRIEGMTKQYGLGNLVSDTTAEGAGDHALIEVDRVRLVGRDAATPVFTIVGDGELAAGEEFRALRRAHDGFLAHYRSRRFDEAEVALAELDHIAPDRLKKLYSVFRNRIAVLRRDPPPSDWDGSFRATEK